MSTENQEDRTTQEYKDKRTKEILARMSKILAEHRGLESNISANGVVKHEYWILKDELNVLRATP